MHEGVFSVQVSPDKVVAMAAKSRLGKEGCHKLMSTDLVDLSFLQSFLPFSCKPFMGLSPFTASSESHGNTP